MRRPFSPPSRAKGAPRPTPAVERAQKAERIAASAGVPLDVARQIAAGRLDLNEAVRRLAFADEVNGLMLRHTLDRALATQVAMGHADLAGVMQRRRVDTALAASKDRTVLVAGRELTVCVHGHKSLHLRVISVDSYEIHAMDLESNVEIAVHKTQMKYAFLPVDFKKVRKALEYDKGRRDAVVEPRLRPQERFACSNRRLGLSMDRKAEVSVVTLEGEVFTGSVGWVSRFEFGLCTRQGAEIVIFRHALDDFRET